MGFKFGIHVMRGIPRLAVKKICRWRAPSSCPRGHQFHDVRLVFGHVWRRWHQAGGPRLLRFPFRLYASWGIDFVKVDDLSAPYYTDEIEAIRSSIDKCGRPIVFSTSPGETPIKQKEHVSTHANMWRVSGDFWDNWRSLNHAFDLAAAWQGVGGPGHWPDSDMIPFGHVGIRCRDAGGDHQRRFTHDEQITLMSLWSLIASPLMLGGNLPDNDDWALSLFTNDDVLAIDQDPLETGQPGFQAGRP